MFQGLQAQETTSAKSLMQWEWCDYALSTVSKVELARKGPVISQNNEELSFRKTLSVGLMKRNAEVKAAAEYPGDSEAHARKLNDYKQVQQQARESLETAQGKILQVGPAAFQKICLYPIW